MLCNCHKQGFIILDCFSYLHKKCLLQVHNLHSKMAFLQSLNTMDHLLRDCNRLGGAVNLNCLKHLSRFFEDDESYFLLSVLCADCRGVILRSSGTDLDCVEDAKKL